jgi:hypothetical protein
MNWCGKDLAVIIYVLSPIFKNAVAGYKVSSHARPPLPGAAWIAEGDDQQREC